MTPDRVYAAAMNQLELQMDRGTFDTHLRDAQFLRFEDGTYYVQVTNDYSRNICQYRIYARILRVFSDVHVIDRQGSERQCQIVFEVAIRQDDLPSFRDLANGTSPAADAPLPDTQADASEEDDQPARQPDEWHFFARVPEAIIDNLDAGPGWLLVKFIRHMNRNTNLLIRKMPNLEKMFGIPRTTIQRHSKVLEDAGHLHIKHGNGRGSANEYRLIGPLAVAVCGVKIANETALQIKLEAAHQPSPTPPEQPESTEDDANKVGQSDRLSDQNGTGEGLKSVNLNLQVDKVGQSDRLKASKVGQFDLPIQSNKDYPDGLKDTDDKPNKIIHSNSGDDLEETQVPPTPPTPTYPALAAWVQEWGEVTTSQNMRLKALSAQYDPAVIQSAMRATVKAYRENIVRYHSRLDYLEAACKQRSGDTLAALAVAAG